jgi:murein DD-endopeptidase MepM/ murein hydrolase activator NlpD
MSKTSEISNTPRLTILALLLVILMAAIARAVPRTSFVEDLTDRVEIIDERTADHGFALWAVSKSDFPMTVSLNLPVLENFRCNVKMPLTVVLQPRKRQLVARLSRVNARKESRYSTSWSYYWGWRSEQPADEVVYGLPFKQGYAYWIVQGFNGKFSHEGRNALDFAMPEGSTICAARGGTVIEAVQSFTEGGISEEMKSKANRVLILHDDGSIARYAHLKYNGALVRVGQKVQMGDEIGLSGATGYAQGPHLHFEVDRPPADLSERSYETIATQFTAANSRGTAVQYAPKEMDLAMRPFPPRDAPLHKFPLNAVEDLTTSRGVSDGRPIDVTEAFGADQKIYVTMSLNLFDHEGLTLTITREGAPAGEAPLYTAEFKKIPAGSTVGCILDPANIESIRGKCMIHINARGQELAATRLQVRG